MHISKSPTIHLFISENTKTDIKFYILHRKSTFLSHFRGKKISDVGKNTNAASMYAIFLIIVLSHTKLVNRKKNMLFTDLMNSTFIQIISNNAIVTYIKLQQNSFRNIQTK